MISEEYKQWDEFSLKRAQFTVLILESAKYCQSFLEPILEILNELTDLMKDYKTRYNGYEVLYNLVNHLNDFGVCSPVVIEICLQGISWKVGKPTEAIRRIACLSFTQAIINENISKDALMSQSKKVCSLFKGCIEDEWSVNLRQSGLNFIKILASEIKNELTQEFLYEIYPIVLSRLDDSNDDIRILAVDALGVVINCSNFRFSKSTMEYIISILFLHMDDPNESLRNRIFWLLKLSSEGDSKEIIEQAAGTNLELYKHKKYCQELLTDN
jgi:hypothetical protein